MASFAELRKRSDAFTLQIQATLEQFAAALQSMDYTRALACQIELDHLDRKARQLEHQNGREPYQSPDEFG
jgi:hypothetical protein